MNQVKHVVTIAEIKYPRASNTIVFLLDQSSSHTAYDSDALQVTRMNVNLGGGQPSMGDTTYNGKVYKLVKGAMTWYAYATVAIAHAEACMTSRRAYSNYIFSFTCAAQQHTRLSSPWSS